MYRLPACIVWLHPAQLYGGFWTFFSCLVCGLLEMKKKKKWEWLETIIELPHSFVDRHGVFFIISDLPGTTLHEERKKRSWSLLSFGLL